MRWTDEANPGDEHSYERIGRLVSAVETGALEVTLWEEDEDGTVRVTLRPPAREGK